MNKFKKFMMKVLKKACFCFPFMREKNPAVKAGFYVLSDYQKKSSPTFTSTSPVEIWRTPAASAEITSSSGAV